MLTRSKVTYYECYELTKVSFIKSLNQFNLLRERMKE